MKNTDAFIEFEDLYNLQMKKYLATFEAVEKLSLVLSECNVDHAVFKTVRPYIFNTVDIDVIVFGGKPQYEKADGALHNAHYERIVRGPMSTTFIEPKMKIGLDLYNEIAVSYIPYIDKNKLRGFVTIGELPDHGSFRTLACEADLLSIIAHSIIKENLYVLSEYYTYFRYLDQLDVDRFVQLVKKTHLVSATRTHTSITALIYKTIHGELLPKFKRIMKEIGIDPMEINRVEQNGFKMPYRYHPLTVARCLFEVAREQKTMKGMVNQAIKSFNREFLRDFIRKLNQHTIRETY
jgi:hypothetical protein